MNAERLPGDRTDGGRDFWAAAARNGIRIGGPPDCDLAVIAPVV